MSEKHIDIWLNYSLIGISLFFAAGILSADILDLSPLWFITFSVFVLFLSFFFRSGTVRFGASVLLLFLFLGLSRMSLWETQNVRNDWVRLLPLKQIALTGTVERFEKRDVSRAVLKLSSFTAGENDFPVRGRILVYFSRPLSPKISAGQTLKILQTDLMAVPPPGNPGQFDYANYLLRRGIVAQTRVANLNQIRFVKEEAHRSTANFFSGINGTLLAKIKSRFSPKVSGFLSALLLGRRESLNKDIRTDFQNAGVIHVLAISGLHVGFVALIIGAFLMLFPIYFKTRNYLLILFLLFYMNLTGNAPPVQRATIMAVIVLVGINIERRYQIFNGLGAAALLILFLHPQQLFWVGFQISFAAVISIVLFTRKIENLFAPLSRKISNPATRRFIGNWIFLPLSVSAAAQFGTIPLIAFYFHKISLIAFILNLIVIPYIGILVGAGFLFLVLSLISGVLAAGFAIFLAKMVEWLIALVHLSAHLPYAYLPVPSISYVSIFLYFSLLLAVFFWNRQRFRYAMLWSGVLLMAWQAALRWNAVSQFNLIAIDVGQGDATLIKTPPGKVILIDGGPSTRRSSAGDYAVKPVLNELGIRRINFLFITHPHLDHLGGAFQLLKSTSIDTVYLPPFQASYFWMDSLRQALKAARVPSRTLRMGDVLAVDGSTRIYVVGPSEAFPKGMSFTGTHINDHSLVLLVREGRHSMLFMGDAERAEEARVRRWGKFLRSDYLKVGHHGGKNSSGSELLDIVRPSIATISVGIYNNYGHPSRQALERLQKVAGHVYRTDRDRAVWLQLKGNDWRRKKWY